MVDWLKNVNLSNYHRNSLGKRRPTTSGTDYTWAYIVNKTNAMELPIVQIFIDAFPVLLKKNTHTHNLTMKGGVDPRKRHKQVFFGTFILFRNYNPWRLTWNSQIKMDDHVPFDSSGVILRWTFRVVHFVSSFTLWIHRIFHRLLDPFKAWVVSIGILNPYNGLI